MASTVWSGRLSFGMVAIPVRLFKAARRERVRFRQVYRPAARIERAVEDAPDTEEEALPEPPRAAAGRTAAWSAEPESPPDIVERVRHTPMVDAAQPPVERAEILKGYEVEKDQFVVFDPQELAALKPRTSTEMEIAQFVKLDEVDPVFFETSYYVMPDQGGEKPYALLFRTLTETGYVAIGKFAMHGREHTAVIRPGSRGLLLHTLFRAAEVRAQDEFQADADAVSAKELQLAKLLVEALAGRFDAAEIRDTREEQTKALIAGRSRSVTRQADAPAKAAAPVIDILEALKKSLEKARKPMAKESAAPPRREKRRANR